MIPASNLGCFVDTVLSRSETAYLELDSGRELTKNDVLLAMQVRIISDFSYSVSRPFNHTGALVKRLYNAPKYLGGYTFSLSSFEKDINECYSLRDELLVLN